MITLSPKIAASRLINLQSRETGPTACSSSPSRLSDQNPGDYGKLFCQKAKLKAAITLCQAACFKHLPLGAIGVSVCVCVATAAGIPESKQKGPGYKLRTCSWDAQLHKIRTVPYQ